MSIFEPMAFGGGIRRSDRLEDRVFLGGTCNGSTWRDTIIPMLNNINIDYFNPVVDDWNEEAKKEELKQREICSVLLYVITSEMKGVYSIAEAVDDSIKNPKRTIFCVLEDGFDEQEINSLRATGEMISYNGGKFVTSLEDVVFLL